MPGPQIKLMIYYEEQGQEYFVEIENTNIYYRFAGATSDDQLASLRTLAAELQNGETDLASSITTILDTSTAPGADGSVIVQQLFGTTNYFEYLGIYVQDAEAAGVSFLIQCLEECGEMLAPLVAA